VATGTTNSSGNVSLNLAGYSGQTLYSFVSYQTANFALYTNVLLGNFCGRSYVYTLSTLSDTLGSTCGQLVIQTRRCDGTTANASKSYTAVKWNGGTYSPYATGTTDASGNATLTGLTYGGANDIYRVTVTDAVGGIVTTDITLTNANCSATVLFRMAIVSSSPCATSQFTITYNSGGGALYKRACCNSCFPTTIKGSLYLHDPYGGTIYSPPTGIGSCGTTCGSCNISNDITKDGPGGDNGWSWTFLNPYSHLDSYSMSCNGISATLSYQNWYSLNGGQGTGAYHCGPTIGFFNYDSVYGSVTAATFSCSPFSATFSIPSRTLTCFRAGQYPWSPVTVCGSVTIPARTITVYE
jgi:hypothetical protein